MSSYNVICKCGHEDSVYVYGPRKNARSRAEYKGAFRLCRECYYKETERKVKEEGLILSASVNPFNRRISIFFTNFSDEIKPRLKELGVARYSERWSKRFLSSTMVDDSIAFLEAVKAEFKIFECKEFTDEEIAKAREEEAVQKTLEDDKKKHDEAKAIAEAEVEKMELPELEGSRAQIDWAIDIRRKILIWAIMHGMDISGVRSITSSKFLIDHRDEYSKIPVFAELYADFINKKREEARRREEAWKDKVDARKWKYASVKENSIEHTSKKAALFIMPEKSKYQGMKFWYPISLIMSNQEENIIYLSYQRRRTIKLIREDDNKKAIEKIEVKSTDVLSEIGELIDNDRFSPLYKWIEIEEEIVHEPARIEPVTVEPDETLKR